MPGSHQFLSIRIRFWPYISRHQSQIRICRISVACASRLNLQPHRIVDYRETPPHFKDVNDYG